VRRLCVLFVCSGSVCAASRDQIDQRRGRGVWLVCVVGCMFLKTEAGADGRLSRPALGRRLSRRRGQPLPWTAAARRREARERTQRRGFGGRGRAATVGAARRGQRHTATRGKPSTPTQRDTNPHTRPSRTGTPPHRQRGEEEREGREGGAAAQQDSSSSSSSSSSSKKRVERMTDSVARE
jgi:hypothetical protein